MIDWSAMRDEYVTKGTSCPELGEKYGAGASTVYARARAEDWPSARREWVSKALALAEEKERAQKLDLLMHATVCAVETAARALEDKEQFNRYIVEKREKYTEGEGNPAGKKEFKERKWNQEEIFGKLDTKALKEMTGILKDLNLLMRDFYDVPTPGEAHARKMAEEKLCRGGDDEDMEERTVEVIFRGAETEEWCE